MKIEPNEVYTTREVAELLKVSLPTIKRMLKDKRLKSTRIGKQHRFLGVDLLEMLSTAQEQERKQPLAHTPVIEAPAAARPVPDHTPPAPRAAARPATRREPPVEPLSTAEIRQRAYMLGKTLLRDMFDAEGNLLFEQGCIVTDEMILTAKRKRKLMELFSNIEHDD